tara:strand:+ start:1114 stop:2007 length:894 start_codon:yes stop_codon:yes gene_type:complete
MGQNAKNKQAELSEEMFAASEKQLARYNDEQAVQRKLLEKQKDKYRKFEFKNPYADMQNQFEENIYEDLTVDMRAAEFQKQQGQQQRANILQSLRGAAGGSGVAGLAQTLANQGQLQSQQIAAGIGQQERQNQMLARQGEIMRRKAAGQIDMTERGGEAMVQSAEMSRQSTLLGIEYGGMAGANAGVQSAYANQMAGFGAQASMLNTQVAGAAQMVSSGMQMVGNIASDRKLKKNINKIGESPSGLNIYSFEFKNSKYGKGVFQGVMSDEIPQEAVGTREGYDTVDYSKLDVEFKQI